MGLSQLEWHEHAGGWVARVVSDTHKTRRYAHVNIYDWAVKASWGLKNKHNKIPVQFQFYKQGYDVTWHDDIDSAKLHVEAIFALTYDDTDSLIHWR